MDSLPPARGRTHIPVLLRKCISRIDMSYAKWRFTTMAPHEVRHGALRNLQVTTKDPWFVGGWVVFRDCVLWAWGRGDMARNTDWLALQVDVLEPSEDEGEELRTMEWRASAEGFAVQFLRALGKVRD